MSQTNGSGDSLQRHKTPQPNGSSNTAFDQHSSRRTGKTCNESPPPSAAATPQPPYSCRGCKHRRAKLTKAIQEYGRLIKTISTLRYLSDSQHRRRVHRQLNKGESLHALRRRLFFANLGQLTRQRNEDQDVQAQCLTLLTNAIIAWNTT